MIIDLDQWFVDDEEATASESRVFPHDLFISHRRFDSPVDLVESLSNCQISVVWDFNLDLRDRRVMQRVSHALGRARFVGLYVSDGFEDSPWCRAEYLNALWVEDKYKIQRALIICESNRSISRIPEILQAVPAFTANEVESIAEHLTLGNLPGESSTAERLFRNVPREKLLQDERLLSFDERLNLLEQRMLFWAEYGNERISFSKKELTTKTFSSLLEDSITEPEILFREVAKIVFALGLISDRRQGIEEKELSRVVRMGECLAECYSIPARASCLTGLDKSAYDFILKPLLLAVEYESTRTESAASYRALCSALILGPFRHEVPVYLAVLESVESGRQSVSSAVQSHRCSLMEAAEAVQNNPLATRDE